MLTFTFDVPILNATPVIRSGAATVTGIGILDKEVTVELDGVANQQWLTVGLDGVEGTGSLTSSSASVTVGCLEGDVNQDRMTSTLDLALVRVLAGAYAAPTTFRRDLNADGMISILDVGLVRMRAGNSLR